MATKNYSQISNPIATPAADDLVPAWKTSTGQTGTFRFDQLADIGGAANSTPREQTSHFNVEYLQTGLTPSDTPHFASMLAAGVGNGMLAGGLNTGAATLYRATAGTGYSGTNKKSTGSQSINAVSGLTGSPTDNLSPLEAHDFVISYDPASSGGVAETWPDARNVDLDTQITSGTLTRASGATARMRVASGATCTTFSGFQSVGFNLAGTDGTLTNCIGFHAMASDYRLSAAITGSLVNYTGVQIDEPDDTNAPLSGTGLGLWINGGYKQFQSAHKFGVSFGPLADHHIYFSSLFGASPSLVIETGILALVDNGKATNALYEGVGTGAEPVPTLGKLPTGAGGTNPMQWIRVQLGSAVYLVPAFSYN